ncbi:MAG: hypothetical protein ACXVRZ_06170 [Gaiellaceae bacterium]
MLLDDASVLLEREPGRAGERDELAAVRERRPPFDRCAVAGDEWLAPPELEVVAFLGERPARVIERMLRFAVRMGAVCRVIGARRPPRRVPLLRRPRSDRTASRPCPAARGRLRKAA